MSACLIIGVTLLAHTAVANTDGLTVGQRQELLRLHNELRSAIARGTYKVTDGTLPPAAMMSELVWDAQLAADSRQYAQKCKWEHDRSIQNLPFDQHTGENLATATNGSMDYLISLWTEEWRLTKKQDMAAMPQAKVHEIGHLTAMAWGDTTRVGCGYYESCSFKFPPMKKPADMGYLVCRYRHGGNIFTTPVYKTGAACSQCDQIKMVCDDATQLCVSKAAGKSIKSRSNNKSNRGNRLASRRRMGFDSLFANDQFSA